MKRLLLGLACLSCGTAALAIHEEKCENLKAGIKSRESQVVQMHKQNENDREEIARLESADAVHKANSQDVRNGGAKAV